MRLKGQDMTFNNIITGPSHEGGMDSNSQSGNAGVGTATGIPKPREFRFVMVALNSRFGDAEIADAAGIPKPREFVFVTEGPQKG